jgi:hypothetical protein
LELVTNSAMKFTFLSALFAAAVASSEVRLLQGQEGALDNGFLMGYELDFPRLQSWRFYFTKEDGMIESNVVHFRHCPTGEACASKKSMSCTSGYGDFMTGLTTFAQIYLDAYENNNQNQINRAE